MLPGRVDEIPYDNLGFEDVKTLLGVITDLEKRYKLLHRLSEDPRSGYNTVRRANFIVNPFLKYRISDLKKRLKYETDIPKKRLIQEALRIQGYHI